MKMLVAGVKNLSGFSKKSNNDFEIPRLFGLVQVENFKKENLQCVGYGFEPMEMQLDPACITQFATVAGKLPMMMELETDVVPSMTTAANAALDASIDTAFTAVKADATALSAIVIPIVVFVLGLTLVPKLIKRFGNKI